MSNRVIYKAAGAEKAFYSIIGYIQSFDQFFVMTEGGPGTSSYVMGLYLYETAFKSYDFGKASAVSFVMFFVILILTLLNSKKKNA